MAAFVDLKQIECQIFLQQRWVYLASSESCNSGSVPMVSHVQFPPKQGKGPFTAEKRKLGGLCPAKSLWLFLAESLLVTESLSSSCWVHAQLLICVWLFVTPWTVACQAPLSMWFPRQGYWSELPFCFPGDLSDPGIEPISLSSPALAGGFFTSEHLGSPLFMFKAIISGYDNSPFWVTHSI